MILRHNLPRILAASALAFSLPALTAAESPNIVLILLDDVGTGWMPPYADRLKPEDVETEVLRAYEKARHGGQPVDVQKHIQAARAAMPTVSKLAGEGAVFDRCFATASLCAPSRAGLLTGSFQQRWGAYSLADVDDYGIPSNRPVLPESLKAAGYRCGLVGKWHVAKKDESIKEKLWVEQLGGTLPIPPGYHGRWQELREQLKGSGYQSSSAPGQHPLDRGFDYYFGYNSHDSKYYQAADLWENRSRVAERPPGEFLTDLFNAKSVAFIEDTLKEKKPFFLYYAPMTLHGGIVPPPKKYSSPFATGIPFSDEYAGHLLALDDGLRQIMETLKAAGQLDNTLFLLTCDNGCTLYNVPPYNAPNRGGKGTGWLGGLNVPLVVWNPGLINPARHTQNVSLADVMPTVLAAAGLPVPTGLDGKSLLPLLRGEKDSSPRTGLGSAGLHSSRWSYSYEAGGELNNQDARECPLYAWFLDGDFLLMRTTAIRPGLYKSLPEGSPASSQVFNLSRDRHERKDIRSDHTELSRKLESGLHEWLSGMKEPLTSQQEDFRCLLEVTK